MPLAQIHLIKHAYTVPQIRLIANTIQSIMETHFHAPPEDRYQIITQHEPHEMICSDTNLGFTRTEKLIFIQIFQQGRDAETKQKTYAEFFRRLSGEAEVGIGEGDLIVSCAANGKEDWSFGAGRAQFLTGEL